jgi:hypothetical protein
MSAQTLGETKRCRRNIRRRPIYGEYPIARYPYAPTLDARVTWNAMKCAFADIRNRYTELTAHIPIQTPKKPTVSAVSAKHFKRKKLLTLAS